jgi:hypothetical protein
MKVRTHHNQSIKKLLGSHFLIEVVVVPGLSHSQSYIHRSYILYIHPTYIHTYILYLHTVIIERIGMYSMLLVLQQKWINYLIYNCTV